MMCTLFKIMLGIGLLFTVSNIRDEVRGETTYYSPGRSSASYMPHHASQSEPESNFRGVMIYQWAYAVGFAIVGGFGLALLRHYDRLDPLSPDFRYPGDDDSSSS
jgi:hypothetical protein